MIQHLLFLFVSLFLPVPPGEAPFEFSPFLLFLVPFLRFPLQAENVKNRKMMGMIPYLGLYSCAFLRMSLALTLCSIDTHFDASTTDNF